MGGDAIFLEWIFCKVDTKVGAGVLTENNPERLALAKQMARIGIIEPPEIQERQDETVI
jgi:hypothetical protein